MKIDSFGGMTMGEMVFRDCQRIWAYTQEEREVKFDGISDRINR